MWRSTFTTLPALRSHGGYTLIELLVTVSIFAITAAIALPQLRAGRMQINTAQRLVIANLRAARTNAMTKSVHFAVEFPAKDRLLLQRMQQVGGTWEVDTTDVRTIRLPAAAQFASGVVGTRVEFNSHGVAVNLAGRQQVDLVDTFGLTKSLETWPSGQVNER